MIQLVMHDGAEMGFTVPSFSCAAHYDVLLEIATGLLRCNCWDSYGRQKHGSIIPDEPSGCKHSALLKQTIWSVRHHA